VAGNLESAVPHFRWTEKLQANDDALHTHGVDIRPAREADAATIRLLNHAEGLALWDYHLQATTLFERMHVAVHAGRIVGYANFFAARWDTALPEFGPLLVATEYRKTGLGSGLTARALQYAQAQGKQRVRLSTLRPTFAFYRPLGFEVTVTWQEQLWKKLRD
jgi:predicted N-acetyltransferase YhbS